MTRSKLGLLGFCAVVLGLLAFNTGIASATVGANWLILMSNGEVLTGAQLNASVGLEKETTSVLHSKILGLTVLYECQKIEAINAKLLKNGTVAKEFNAEGKPVGSQVKFSECIAIIGGEFNANCTPNAGGAQFGVILTNPGHGLIVLHTLGIDEPVKGVKITLVEQLVQVLPDSGETFATIESSAACPVGKKVPVIGKATLKELLGEFSTHQVKHLTELVRLTELWTLSKTEEHIATILGSAFMFLTGEHNGLAWSGDPT